MKKIGILIIFILLAIFTFYFFKLCYYTTKSSSLFKKLYNVYAKDNTYNCNNTYVCKKEEIRTINDIEFKVERKLYYDGIQYDGNDSSYYKLFFTNETMVFNVFFLPNKITFIYNNNGSRFMGEYDASKDEIYDFIRIFDNDFSYDKLEEETSSKYKCHKMIKEIVNLVNSDL